MRKLKEFIVKYVIKKWMLRVFNGIIKDIESVEDMGPRDKKDYFSRAKQIYEDKVLINECNKLVNDAGKDIIRHCSTDTEVAFNRGIIRGMELLQERLNYLSARYDTFDVEEEVVE